jgi:hypothetical protein
MDAPTPPGPKTSRSGGSPASLDVVGLLQAELITSKAKSVAERRRAFETIKAVLLEFHDSAKSAAYADDLRTLVAAFRSLEANPASKLERVEGSFHTANKTFQLAHNNFGKIISSAAAVAAAVMGTLGEC